LQKACPEATFAGNPLSCPSGSNVGSATVSTPVLPTSLTGPAYLVSHGGSAFTGLDLILEGGGVRVIIVASTTIKNGVTSSTFASIPDVPLSSFTLNLPMSPHSALAANGNLCTQALSMPTTITAQIGAQIKQDTRISVSNCPVRIVAHRVRGQSLILKVQAFAAGRISGKGANLRTSFRNVDQASTTTLELSLSRSGLNALLDHHRLKAYVRVGFVPKQKGESSSTASTTVTFRQ
jgi:hypothetical protein